MLHVLRIAVKRSLTQACYLTYVTQLVPVVTYQPSELIFSRQYAIMHSAISCACFFSWAFVSELILMPQADLSVSSTRTISTDTRKASKADNMVSMRGAKSSIAAIASGTIEKFSRSKEKKNSDGISNTGISSPRKQQQISTSTSTSNYGNLPASSFGVIVNPIFSYLGQNGILVHPHFVQTTISIFLAGLHILNAVDAIFAMRNHVSILVSYDCCFDKPISVSDSML
jgi:hypothetical protein